MGVEFLEKTKPTIKRHLDKKRRQLVAGDLFTQLPTDASRTGVVSVSHCDDLNEGDSVVVETSPSGVGVSINGEHIGYFEDPADYFTSALGVAGAASGTINHVYTLAKKIEVSLL